MKMFDPLYKLVSTTQAKSSSPFNPSSLLPGLFTLTPLTSIAQRTAQSGTSPLDPLVLAPGLHLQLTANDLNKGEYPACAALTTGYVFRVENPATVYFLQRVGRTGYLTDLKVSAQSTTSRSLPTRDEALASLGYYASIGCSIFALQRVYALGDIWGLFFMSNLILTRLINFVILRRRSQPGWFGAPEPGVEGDLFILLSQDRWVRIRGQVDDLKALTSGTWLSEPTTLEGFFEAVAKLLIYANVAVAGHATDAGVWTIVSMLLVNGGLLAWDNLRIHRLSMYGRTMQTVGEPKRYFRRRDLAEQLIKESGRDDWAVAMGLIVKDNASKEKDHGVKVTM
ncbi:Alcohol dehydrogenase zinc-binding domain [Pyrenophora seminiperda CCB06]|uniref:Alcohol dehydrogenase zinc-binding domain n=1 Tax=Pyrenophora seminiperda CCB06 TaxID=1302712 RepID=A0A3M7M5G1_9PLEO|nr:Alcohol dehydrogenase zinc-binding domain [Pyrenophora seminiperda CCB06]